MYVVVVFSVGVPVLRGDSLTSSLPDSLAPLTPSYPHPPTLDILGYWNVSSGPWVAGSQLAGLLERWAPFQRSSRFVCHHQHHQRADKAGLPFFTVAHDSGSL